MGWGEGNERESLPRLGPRRLGKTLSVKPGISLSPCLTMMHESTRMSLPTMQPRTDLRLRSPSRRAR